MVSKMEFERIAQALQVLWSQAEHSQQWEQGFLAAVEAFSQVLGLSEGRVVGFAAYAGLTGDATVLRITTAPAEYDGLGTEFQAPVGTNTRTKETFRRVSIQRETLEWQEERYESGGYRVFALQQWLKLEAEAWFAQDYTKVQEKKPGRDYLKNFKGREFRGKKQPNIP